MDQLPFFIIICYVLLREYHSEENHSLTPFIDPFDGSWHIYRNPVTVCKTTHQSAITQITPKLCDYHHQRNNTERDLKKKLSIMLKYVIHMSRQILEEALKILPPSILFLSRGLLSHSSWLVGDISQDHRITCLTDEFAILFHINTHLLSC